MKLYIVICLVIFYLIGYVISYRAMRKSVNWNRSDWFFIIVPIILSLFSWITVIMIFLIEFKLPKPPKYL